MKNKNKIFTCGLLASAFLSAGVMAQTRVVVPNTGTPPLIYYTYNAQEMQAAGCDPVVWNEMVTNFVERRTRERIQQGTIQVREQSTPPVPVGGTSGGLSCFENATNQINRASGGVNSLISIFSGGVDWNALSQSAVNQLSNAACNQVDSYLGNITSGALQPINSTLGQTRGAITGAGVGTPLGTVGIGGAITPAPNTNTIPNVTAPTINQGGAQTAAAGFWGNIQQINPFR